MQRERQNQQSEKIESHSEDIFKCEQCDYSTDSNHTIKVHKFRRQKEQDMQKSDYLDKLSEVLFLSKEKEKNIEHL